MKVDRLIAIIMVLMERDMIGAAELAEMFEVSLRTIYRDIEAIGKAGIPIVSSTGPMVVLGLFRPTRWKSACSPLPTLPQCLWL